MLTNKFMWLVSIRAGASTQLLRIFDNEQSALDYWLLTKYEKDNRLKHFDEAFINKVPVWN